MRFASFLLCLLLLIGAAIAQTDRGTITGTIADPSGAVIGGATISAKNTQTEIEYTAASTATGNYTLAQLPAGSYELSVIAAGFKKYVRPGIVVSVAQVVRINATLEVGQISEVVTVQADAPLLKTESGELSHNIDYARMDDIPVLTLGTGAGLGNIRNPLQVVTLLPGSAFANDNTLRINGMPSSSQAVRIEGQDATNGMWRQQNQVNQAGLDAIQEVSIQTSNFSAEFGQAGGGYFNYTMRSGSSQLHGSAYDYLVNEAFNAGTPFTDDGTGSHVKNKQRRNDYGFTFGGPVYLPKIYDGREKTFFFFSFEQFRESQTVKSMFPATTPIDAYRRGDFSQALGPQMTRFGVPVFDPLGRPVYQNEIYNPFYTYTGPNNEVMRDPFMGCDGQSMNVICTDPGSPFYVPLDSVALKIQDLLPGPTRSGVVNNYAVPDYDTFRHTTIPSFKIDHNLSAKIKISGYFSATLTRQPAANGYTQAFTSAAATDNRAYTYRFNYDHTISPTMLFHFGAGYMSTFMPVLPLEFDQGTLGFKNDFFLDAFPVIGGLSGALQKGGSTIPMGIAWARKYSKESKPTANASLTWVKGNHTLKAGGELTLEGLPTFNYSRAGGNYTFGAQQTGIPWEFGQSFNGTTGFPYASFLLGLSNQLDVSQITVARLGNHTLGLFVQDSWKATRRLTLDYGLRWDLSNLLREQYGRMQNADFNISNSHAVPPGASEGLPGSVTYEATCHCDFGQTYKYAFGPRLGVAYQIDDKTVFRAGAGISYGTSPNNAFLSLSVPDFYTFVADGYGNPATVLADGNPRPNLTWPDFSNNYPFTTPSGLNPPISPFISIAANTGRLPRIFQWSIGLQREVARNVLVEAAYVGNRGAWWTAPLLAAQNYNALTPEGLLHPTQSWAVPLDIANLDDRALLTLPISNPAVIARFPQLVNPNVVYQGFPSTQPLNQALRPHPQWYGVPPFLGPPLGNTWYDALQAKVTKRFSHGLDVQAAFTWQKELTLGVNSDTSYLTPSPVIINDVYDRKSQKQLSAFSRPVMFVVSFNYTTPRFAASTQALKVLSVLARDWTFGGVLRYQSGDLIRTPASTNGLLDQLARGRGNNPAMWGGGTTVWNRVEGEPLFLTDPNGHIDPTQQLMLNPDAWTDPPAGTFGTSAPYYGNYRWRRQPSEALSFGRNFPLKERATLHIRIEFQNAFNRLFFANPLPINAGGFPNTGNNPASPTTYYPNGDISGGYGYVNTVGGGAASPRSGQIVARINF